ncbi:uncharacterized protein [Typha latifolia]|uniref:uncharacterized protein isoform X1 n=1 Tax=Typha latifolia TaxID=4733 RepID=UPI003C301621
MDIPNPEELEWLDSNGLLPEEGDNQDDYFMEEDLAADQDDPVEEIYQRKISDPPTARENQINKKWIWSEENKDSEDSRVLPHEEEGRTKRRALYSDDPDEDWLHYSPSSKDVAAGVALEADASKENIISRFASEIEGDFMSVTGPSGERVYAKMSSREMAGGQSKFVTKRATIDLLSEPVSILSKRVEQEALAKALQESFESQDNQTRPSISLVNEKLWVEKYAPTSFTELLSDEQTNREVLLWLKQWDSSVFGSQVRATTDDVLSSLRRHSSVVQHQKFSNSKKFVPRSRGAPMKSQHLNSLNVTEGENNNLKGIYDSCSKRTSIDHPPEHKVLLLCGPPGLGKTTLAHVVAKHCGYRVVEINASDDRSTSTIESKILDVVQMNSVMPDSKPKCLVIDEIDGALNDGKGAVDVILKMVAAEKNYNLDKGNAAQEGQPQKSSSKKVHRQAKLSRPVICICNDLYAPALRQLRQVAKVHTFVQPTISRVVNRLRYICKKEGFKTSTIALSALAENTECDIRSCLNTLQFLNKKKETLNILDVDSQIVGRKDMSRSIFDVWKEVFYKKKLKRGRKAAKGHLGKEDWDFLYSLIANCGEYELTMDGIHENFLRLSYHDPMMQKTVKCLDILGISDSLLQYGFRTQHMSLHAYQPPIVISLSYLIAQVEKPNIEWPKTSQRCRAMLKEKKELLKTWQSKISPTISRHLSIESFVEDVISPLLHTLSPPNLRPVALHLFSEREKDELAELIDTMVSYCITYKISKIEPRERMQRYGASPDAPPLSLDPPINDFINFKDYQSEYSGLSIAMKQVLLHEVEKQRILQDSVGKILNLIDESNSKKEVSATINSKAVPAVNIPTPASTEKSCKQNLTSVQRQKIAHTAPSPSSAINVNFPGALKKPSSSSKFFDRFRKENSRDSKTCGDAL